MEIVDKQGNKYFREKKIQKAKTAVIGEIMCMIRHNDDTGEMVPVVMFTFLDENQNMYRAIHPIELMERLMTDYKKAKIFIEEKMNEDTRQIQMPGL